jgi:xanthine dehydrogenase accessory factor
LRASGAGLVAIRGGGELGSAVARLLFLAGHAVCVLERAQPLTVRRLVSFGDAVRTGATVVEGVVSRCVTRAELDVALSARAAVPVLVDPDAALVRGRADLVLIDARMLKRGPRSRLPGPSLLIGLGPGFVAGEDVDAVVETQRGADMGRVIWAGPALADTGEPAAVGGVTQRRVLRAPASGAFRAAAAIGALVRGGEPLGRVGEAAVRAGVGGLLRGLIADGVSVDAGMKVGDVDPRGAGVDPARISDKGRAVAAGVLEAVVRGRREGGVR